MPHTPGPWTQAGAQIAAFGEAAANICTVSSPRSSAWVGAAPVEVGDPDFDEAYANARLIAAAPALLAALKELHRLDTAIAEDRATERDWDEAFRRSKAVVARAE
jgi:hypothetical protein